MKKKLTKKLRKQNHFAVHLNIINQLYFNKNFKFKRSNHQAWDKHPSKLTLTQSEGSNSSINSQATHTKHPLCPALPLHRAGPQGPFLSLFPHEECEQAENRNRAPTDLLSQYLLCAE